MAWLKAHLKTLFNNKKPKNPPKPKRLTREEKGKARALGDTEYPPSSTGSSASSSAVTDSDLLPILHYTELNLVPQILTQFPAFYLVGHPLPAPPLPQAKQLLTLPDDVKRTLVHPGKSTVRGYNSAKSSGREWWDYAPEDGGTRLTIDDEGFKGATKEYFEQSIALLQRICGEFNTTSAVEGEGETEGEGGEKKIVVPQDIIDHVGFSTMRYLRYSPVIFDENKENASGTTAVAAIATTTSNEDVKAVGSSSRASSKSTGSSKSSSIQKDTPVSTKENGYTLPRMEAHTDHGVLTLMTATEPSGLYVWDRNGKIFSAPPIDNTVLIIAGDLMTHFTAAEGKSPLEGEQAVDEKTVLPTVHAVVIPKGAGERYSVAVFLRPKKDLVVSRRAMKKDGKDEVDEMTFGRWAQEKGDIKGRRCWMLGQEKLSGGEDI
ncbi:hypothetical protein H072_476 [Dactylellina haptotyla CBS 200.50]|uniref:Fe2OG dioxygenase domain-containing protein n=1 Tax=Dactylellina haptotyla (strain CBS 200.50) TaxID=1284197 RepID=S8CD09_DACHA|nr:hypothetical protein H072_476 [Dactylellina haptotyla CBS 200.50]